MTSIQLYKFITENQIEWKWEIDGENDNVLIFVAIYNLEAFNEILSPGIFDDGGISCNMKDGYFCFWMQDICDYYGVEIEEVFEKNKK